MVPGRQRYAPPYLAKNGELRRFTANPPPTRQRRCDYQLAYRLTKQRVLTMV